MGWSPGTDLAFKCGLQVFSRIEVSALGGPFQKVGASLLYLFQNQFWCVLVIVIQVLTILLLISGEADHSGGSHYSIHFLQPLYHFHW